MIDIEKAQNAFNEYVSEYNAQDPQIALKINHINNVTAVAENIAKSLNLNEEDIELAKLIALLHDIGRFEQIKRYHTFSDKDSINHAEFGVQLLRTGLIRKFIDTDEYDTIICTCILNHNKNRVDNTLDSRTKLHANILRDADKIDIYRVLLNDSIEAIYNGCKNMSEQFVTQKIYRQFLEENEITYPDMKTSADNVVAHCAYVFDFNFKYSLNVMQQNNCIERLVSRMNFIQEDTIQKFEIIKKVANEYINSRLSEIK